MTSCESIFYLEIARALKRFCAARRCSGVLACRQSWQYFLEIQPPRHTGYVRWYVRLPMTAGGLIADANYAYNVKCTIEQRASGLYGRGFHGHT